MKMLSFWSYESIDSSCEHPTGISLTVPDQSLSVREILDRFAKGLAPRVALSASYDGLDISDSVDPLRNSVDITEIEAESRRLNALRSVVEQSKPTEPVEPSKEPTIEPVSEEMTK